MTAPILDIRDVVKRFATVTAVDHVSFDVVPGEVVALLGPNGAGKTTLVRMMMGIIEPDAGRVSWALDGHVAPPDRARIGFLPEERGLFPDVPVLRALVYFAMLRGMSRRDAESGAMRWLERLGLGERAKETVKSLSKGNQQKVQFVAAVLHAPRFAVLDEPFSGLDPINQELFLELIDELRRGGTTVLLSAHQMDLVERIADRIVLMNLGRRLESGTIGELRERWGAGEQLSVHFASGDPAPLARLPMVDAIEPMGEGAVRLRLHPGAPMRALLAEVATHLDVVRVHSEQVRLHEIYVGLMGADGANGTGDGASAPPGAGVAGGAR